MKFYAVKVGRNPGIYESWEDCKRQVTGYPGNQYKSFSTRSEAEKYVEGPAKSVEGPARSGEISANLEEVSGQPLQTSSLALPEPFKVHPVELPSFQSVSLQPNVVYQLEFDGASKGNPGKAGAGALLRYPDGSVAFELKECLGTATNNVAEYCSLILGLRGARARGVKRIRVQGDSLLVCLQVRGVWKLKNEGLIPLHKTVKQLEEFFEEFSIAHVDREFNSAADALANAAVYLPESEFAREFVR